MKQMSAAQRRAIAINYAKKERGGSKASTIRGRGAYTKTTRTIPRKTPRTPLYRHIQGKGDYSSSNSSFKQAGMDIGRSIGGALGYGLGTIFGSGAYNYNILANSIMGGVYDPPELHNKSDRNVCIKHREYIADITASTDFTLQQFSINPGLTNTFPWLSQVAEAFEEYRFTGIVFEYKTLSADYTTASSAALGYVVMATQYNVLNPPFPDKKTMENYEFSNDGKPSISFMHPVECKRSLNPVSELFVRTGTPTAGDLRLYDHGLFQIATGGNTGTGVIGELWATFEIEFYKPKLVAGVGSELLSDHWSATEAIINANPFGSVQTLSPGSNLGTTLTTDGIVSFPPNMSDGTYLVIYTVFGTSGVVLDFSANTSNVNFINFWRGDSTQNLTNGGTTSDVYIKSFVLQIINPGASFQIVPSSGALPNSPQNMDLVITQINGNIDG